jgi:hypothetical protein
MFLAIAFLAIKNISNSHFEEEYQKLNVAKSDRYTP